MALAACTTTVVGIEPDQATVETFGFPLLPQPKIDVIAVIDDSPAMAGQRERLATELAASAARADLSTIDMQLVVMASDGTFRGTLSSRGREDGPPEQSFGDLGVELAALGDVGSSGTNRAIETAALALQSLAGDGRDKYVVFVLGSDDASGLELGEYVGRFDHVPVLAALPWKDAPRMWRFLAEQWPNDELQFDDGFGSRFDLVPVVRAPGNLFVPCFDDRPIASCSMSVDWVGGGQVIPACGGGALPCWSFEYEPDYGCASGNALRIHGRNEGWNLRFADPDTPLPAKLSMECEHDP